MEASGVGQKVMRAECETWSHGETQQKTGTELVSSLRDSPVPFDGSAPPVQAERSHRSLYQAFPPA